jgi:hypothetical protein
VSACASSEHCTATYEVSTGGIIALGLGHQGWSVSESIKIFRELSTQAFTKHRSPSLLELPTIAIKHGKYRTSPLEEAFKKAFSEKVLLFGDPNTSEAVRTKAAVVTTNLRGQVTLISNYNRRVSKGRK